MCQASCLVTSSPEFEDPEQTPPVLLAASALPDPRNIIVIEPSEPSIRFSADVESAEDLDQPILVRLYVDYGVEGVNKRPFFYSKGSEVLPSTTGQQRIATAEWFRGEGGVTPGCHTFTLMVSHAFDASTDCPERLDDASQVTWQAFICAETGPCPPPIGDPRLDCPVATVACRDVADEPVTTSSTASTGAGP